MNHSWACIGEARWQVRHDPHLPPENHRSRITMPMRDAGGPIADCGIVLP